MPKTKLQFRAIIETAPDVFCGREHVLADPKLKIQAIETTRLKLRALARAVQFEILDLIGLGEDGHAEYGRFLDCLKERLPDDTPFRAAISPKENA